MNTEQRTQDKHVAILGFAEPCSAFNQNLAFTLGSVLAEQGYVVTAGNITSTFYNAFKGAKNVNGNTLAVLEKQTELNCVDYCDVVVSVCDTKHKHKLLAELCSYAIIIGGGNGTKHIESEFLKLNKTVIALNNTGGIVRSELNKKTKRVNNIKETLAIIN